MTNPIDPMRALLRGPLRVWTPLLCGFVYLLIRIGVYAEFDYSQLGVAPELGAPAIAALVEAGSLALLLAVVVLGCAAVAIRWGPFRALDFEDPARAELAWLWRPTAWVVSSLALGGLTAWFVGINTQFFGVLGLSGPKLGFTILAAVVSWSLSWSITFNLCGLLARHTTWSKAARKQFRALLYANAALVAVGTLVTVTYFEAARGRIEAAGARPGLVDALTRATALFYVLHLLVVFVPVRLLLRRAKSGGSRANAAGAKEEPTEWPLKLLDAVALFSPLLADLAAGALRGT